jgi:hypothetical protein
MLASLSSSTNQDAVFNTIIMANFMLLSELLKESKTRAIIVTTCLFVSVLQFRKEKTGWFKCNVMLRYSNVVLLISYSQHQCGEIRNYEVRWRHPE